MNFVEITSASGRYYGLYRIMPTMTTKSADSNYVKYECQHVVSTLMDDILDGYHQYTNYSTTYVLTDLLAKQETKHWRLGVVEFERYFHYSFENENGLLAPIFSIPQPFDEQFEFTYDTTTYPWKINLVKVSDEVVAEKRWGKDMLSFDEVSDPTEIVNYLVPKGSGEGVNQLTIADENGGKRFLKDDASIARWGKRSYIWIDRIFEDAASLKSSAQALLNKWKDPRISFTTKAADLSILPEHAHERRMLNGVTRIIVEDKTYFGRIIEEHIADLSEEYNVSYKVSNKLDDIATIQADVERKQQVNEAYSQGATNILSYNYQDNCDSNIPAVIPFYIDDDVVNVNTCELTFRTKRFRAYSTATHGGGAIVKSTKGGGAIVESTSSGGGTTRSTTSGGSVSTSTQSGGSSTQTSSSGGGTSKSTNSGGGSTQSSTAALLTDLFILTTGPLQGQTYENHQHSTNIPSSKLSHSHSVSIPSHSHSFSTPNHTHSVSIPSHTHDFTIPSHSHDVSIPNHSHDINLPNHTHDIELPDHTHDVKHEIVELTTTPTSITLKVDGNLVDFSGTSGDRINLVDYMGKDANGKITRGRHEVEISPNGLARIEADLILRVFIRSHLGGAY